MVKLSIKKVQLILGSNIKRMRSEKGISITILSKLSKVSSKTLYNIEKATANPLFSTILKLSKALKIHSSLLFDTI